MVHEWIFYGDKWQGCFQKWSLKIVVSMGPSQYIDFTHASLHKNGTSPFV